MPKNYMLVSSDHNTISESFRCALANFRRAWTFPGGLGPDLASCPVFIFFFAKVIISDCGIPIIIKKLIIHCLVLTGSAALHICSLPPSNSLKQSQCMGHEEGDETDRRNS